MHIRIFEINKLITLLLRASLEKDVKPLIPRLRRA
jgi:hypothetical protein